MNKVPGRLEEELRRELADAPSDEDHFVAGLTRAARDFPRETAAAFQSLTAEAQRSRLVGSWRRFGNPVFLPLVRSLYRFPAESSDQVRDIALRRLYELAPREGHAAMLSELRRDRLRVSMETLTLMPDRTCHVSTPDGRGSWTARPKRPFASRRRGGLRGSGPDESLRQ